MIYSSSDMDDSNRDDRRQGVSHGQQARMARRHQIYSHLSLSVD